MDMNTGRTKDVAVFIFPGGIGSICIFMNFHENVKKTNKMNDSALWRECRTSATYPVA